MDTVKIDTRDAIGLVLSIQVGKLSVEDVSKKFYYRQKPNHEFDEKADYTFDVAEERKPRFNNIRGIIGNDITEINIYERQKLAAVKMIDASNKGFIKVVTEAAAKYGIIRAEDGTTTLKLDCGETVSSKGGNDIQLGNTRLNLRMRDVIAEVQRQFPAELTVDVTDAEQVYERIYEEIPKPPSKYEPGDREALLKRVLNRQPNPMDVAMSHGQQTFAEELEAERERDSSQQR